MARFNGFSVGMYIPTAAVKTATTRSERPKRCFLMFSVGMRAGKNDEKCSEPILASSALISFFRLILLLDLIGIATSTLK
jgi:hypothetical protein